MSRRSVTAFLWGIATAIVLQMIHVEADRRAMIDVVRKSITGDRCEYRFPWSGKCSRPNHHEGDHF